MQFLTQYTKMTFKKENRCYIAYWMKAVIQWDWILGAFSKCYRVTKKEEKELQSIEYYIFIKCYDRFLNCIKLFI